MNQKTTGTPNEPDFDAAMARLEQIAETMDEGSLGLAELQALFEEGMHLARLCGDKLDAVEKRVELLLEQPGGEVERRPLADIPVPVDEDERPDLDNMDM